MAKTETISTRSPRGTKPVSEAFFTALARIPTASRGVVAKAAQAMIRDELKIQRDKAKAADAKQKAAKPVAVKAPVAAKQTGATKKAVATKPSAPATKAKAKKVSKPVQAKTPAAEKSETKPAETAAAV